MRKFTLALPLLLAGCLMYEDRQVIPARNPVSVADVIGMRQEGASNNAIYAEITHHGVFRKPGADDLVALKQAGIADWIVKAMIDAPVTTPRPEQVVVRRSYRYDDGATEAAIFGLGAVIGYSLGHNGYYSHRHYYGCGHGGW
jgi:hypothetical protein